MTTEQAIPPPRHFVASLNRRLGFGRPVTDAEARRLWAAWSDLDGFRAEFEATVERECAGRRLWWRAR
jgi:hypothetical protein